MRGCSCNGCRKRRGRELKSVSSAEYGPKTVFTLDRINRLRRRFDLSESDSTEGMDVHRVLDALDRAAHILTRPENSQRYQRSSSYAPDTRQPEFYVGARLARLEEKVFGVDKHTYQAYLDGVFDDGRYSFWLGEFG